ncbi:MAG: 2'-5' RNA ligase family protein [Lachnospiraceae bacterium]|nr:2'-5' RNA ligase family protein [Lachnospiraceae bacterium]
MYLISVYFDDHANKILQRYIDEVAKATGNTFMIDHKVPPHITISSIEAKSVDVLKPAFESLAEKLAFIRTRTGNSSFGNNVQGNFNQSNSNQSNSNLGESNKIQIVSVGQLLPYVLYATPVLNEMLQDLQEVVYDTFKDIEDTDISRFYQPYSWLPHITLGKKMDKEQMISAIKVMQEKFAPLEAIITKIGLAKVNPHEDVCVIELA